MSGGQPTPPILPEAFAINAPDVAAPNGTAGAKTSPFPAASQVGILNGAASLNDGFPPLTMTDPTAGGVPPFGEDMNGALYLISAWVAYLAAGQIPVFSSTLSTAMGGYAIGAVLQQTADPTAFWINTLAANTANPDMGTPGLAGWVSTKPIVAGFGLSSGSNYALPGPSDYILDVGTGGGAVVLSGVVAQRDGQTVTFRKISTDTNTFTLAVLAGGTGNQIQYPGDLVMAVQYAGFTIRYNAALAAWVVI